MKVVDIRGYEKFYTISDEGDVFSKRLGRNIKLGINWPFGYYKVWLTNGGEGRTYGVGPLVLENFVCLRPRGLECHHKDHNKLNNSVGNLSWVTHSDNLLATFRDNGRVGYWKGKKMKEVSIATREKMAIAKNKPIRALRGDRVLEFRSIEECITGLMTYRKRINRCMNAGRELDGWRLEFI